MTTRQIVILAILAVFMLIAALTMGSWSEQINPDGIAQHPAAEGVTTEMNQEAATGAARDAYSFGVSLGLLATALLYCCFAIGLLIHARSKGRQADAFIYWVAGFAGLGFALSYLIDDYFY